MIKIIWIPEGTHKLLIYEVPKSKVERAIEAGGDPHNDWEWLKANGKLVAVDNPEDYEEVDC